MWGAIVSVIAGMAMSVQGVMNARLGEGIGTMEANALVQGTAFALSPPRCCFTDRAALRGWVRWTGSIGSAACWAS
jgi:uncharacterized membrane protein YdcZ (DUF606 family)